MPLASMAQADYSAGMVRAVARHLLPPNGLYDAKEALLDDGGSVYRRGGSEYLSTADFGTSGLRFIWEGYLTPGRRTFFANADDFGVLDDAEAPVNLGGAGLTAPVRPVELAGILFLPGGVMYGGSRKSANYSTGTITVTNGSKTVTGSGTTWNTLVDAGMLLQVGSERVYPVQSIDSTTQLTLREPYEGTTGGGKAYTLRVLAAASAPYTSGSIYGVATERLLIGAGNKISFTARNKPHSLDPTDYHELPDGVNVLGIADLRDAAFVFHTNGLTVISNLAYDATDDQGNLQHRLEHVTSELILWSPEGIATWQNALVVPAKNGLWLIDGISTPVLLSRSITPLYLGYVRSGYKTGQAVAYRGHYFLPILDAANGFVDLLVCRVDRPVEVPGFGTVFPWTRWLGSAGEVSAVAVRSGTSPVELLGASRQAAGRVLKLSGTFEPQGSRKNDHDGTTHQLDLTTRDYDLGLGRPNIKSLVRRLRVRYELEDAASDNPKLSAYCSIGTAQPPTVALWGTAIWGTSLWGSSESSSDVQLEGQAPEDDGREPYTWKVGKRGRFIRFRLVSSGPAAKLTLRVLELMIRDNRKA